MKKLFLFVCLLFFPLISAHAEVRVQEEQVMYRMHFGMGVGTNAITPELFTEFLTKHVSPHFPQGLTATSTRGQWFSPEIGIVKERTTVVDVYGDNSAECKQKIAEIAENYVKQFKRVKASLFVVSIPGVTTTLWF